jgi:hypothetical protein
VALHDQFQPLARLGRQLVRLDDARLVPQAQHPGEQLPRLGVLGLEDHAVVGVSAVAGVAEVAEREPVDPVGEPDPGSADGLAELPVGPGGV